MKLNIHSGKILPIASGCILAVLAIADLVLYMPVMDNINQAKDKQQKLSQQVVFASGLLKIQSQATLRPLITEDKLDDLMYSISDLAKKQDLTVKLNSRNIRTSKGSSYTAKSFEIDLTGPLKKLGSFVLAIKDLPDEIVIIKNISITPFRESPEDVQARLTLTVLTMNQ